MTYMLKPLSFVLVILLGFTLRRIGFFSAGDHRLLSKIMIQITLPCAVIQAFDGFSRDTSLLWIVPIGLCCAFLPMVVMGLATRGQPAPDRAYKMINIGGYNIGCFSLPIIQALFGGAGAVVACMFDIGNAIIMTGGCYAFTSTVLHTGGQRETPGSVLMKFLKSPPFDAYILMFAFTALGIALPAPLFELTRPAGQANSFISMLMIGMMFEPTLDKSLLKKAGAELACRYAFAVVFAVLLYALAPFDLATRRVLAVLCFAPLSSLTPIYTDRCGGDTALAGFTNSASIAVGLAVMLAMSMAFLG